jgi:hypothetical protein
LCGETEGNGPFTRPIYAAMTPWYTEKPVEMDPRQSIRPGGMRLPINPEVIA